MLTSRLEAAQQELVRYSPDYLTYTNDLFQIIEAHERIRVPILRDITDSTQRRTAFADLDAQRDSALGLLASRVFDDATYIGQQLATIEDHQQKHAITEKFITQLLIAQTVGKHYSGTTMLPNVSLEFHAYNGTYPFHPFSLNTVTVHIHNPSNPDNTISFSSKLAYLTTEFAQAAQNPSLTTGDLAQVISSLKPTYIQPSEAENTFRMAQEVRSIENIVREHKLDTDFDKKTAYETKNYLLLELLKQWQKDEARGITSIIKVGEVRRYQRGRRSSDRDFIEIKVVNPHKDSHVLTLQTPHDFVLKRYQVHSIIGTRRDYIRHQYGKTPLEKRSS